MTTNALGMAVLAASVALVAGCGHYRQHQQAEFERRVADRCVEAASSRQTQVVIIPAASASVATPAQAPLAGN